MGYIHCCGGLRKTRTFRLSPQDGFALCEIDLLEKCPCCGNKYVQLTRIDENNNITTIKKSNEKANKFFEKIKSKIIYEEDVYENASSAKGKFYLYYNEFGVRKKCYSNLTNMKLGLTTLI